MQARKKTAAATASDLRLHDALAQAIAAEGVDTHFTLMGNGNMHLSVELASRHNVRNIHARHENCAVMMAMAYARYTHRVGFASVTHGPGYTQIMTALTTAVRGDIPVVVFAAETATNANWHLQELDQAPLARATGASYVQIRSIENALDRTREAFYVARSRRQPVVLGVPLDLQRKVMPAVADYVPSTTLVPHSERIIADPESLAKAADLIVAAKRPIIIAGRGAMRSGAREALIALAEQCGALLTTSLPGRGFFHGDEFDAGIAGGWSRDSTVELFGQADLVIGVGVGLGHHTTNGGKLFPQARTIQIDVQPNGLRQMHPIADYHVRADAKDAAEQLLRILTERGVKLTGFRTPEIAARIARAVYDVKPFPIEAGTVDPRLAVQELSRVIPKDWAIVGGSGHSAHFTGKNMPDRPPDQWVSIRDFGAIGSALSHAIGVAAARNNDGKVLLIDGDGGLIMHIAELETVRRHGLKLLIVCLNDGAFGAEIHKLRAQGLNHNEAFFGREDFASVARGFRHRGETVTSLGEFERLFAEHQAADQTSLWNVHIAGDTIANNFLENHADMKLSH